MEEIKGIPTSEGLQDGNWEDMRAWKEKINL